MSSYMDITSHPCTITAVLSVAQKSARMLPEDFQQILYNISKKQIDSKILEWFGSWRPWQRKILLCGMTNRCSPSQLELLITTLEPVFHRDFATGIRQRYPSAPLRGQQSKNAHSKTKVKKSYPKDTSEAPSKIKSSVNKLAHTQGKQQTIAIKFAEKLALDLFEDAQLSIKQYLCGQDSQNSQRKASCNEFIESLQLKDTLEKMCFSCKEDSDATGTTNIPMCATTSVNDPSNVVITGKENEGNVLAADMHAIENKTECETIKEAYLHKNVGEPITGKSNVRNLLPELKIPLQSTQKKLQKKKPVGVNCIIRLPAIPLLHQHRSSTRASQVQTADYFDHKKLVKFGLMQTAREPDQVKKPSRVEDIMATAQQLYKNHKWWPVDTRSGQNMYRPHRFTLSKQFMAQLRQVWQWVDERKTFEKLALLTMIVKQCDPDQIAYLSQCLVQRLHEDVNINWLSDDTLHHIFSYLTLDEIDIASQVCRRWKYLCSREDIWIDKCKELGNMEGVPSLISMMQNTVHSAHDIDWRLAHLELTKITSEIKTTDLPEEVQLLRDEATWVPRHKLHVTSRLAASLDECTPQASKPETRMSYPPLDKNPGTAMSWKHIEEYQLPSRERSGDLVHARKLAPITSPVTTPSPVDPPTDTTPLKPWIRNRQKAVEEEGDVAFDIRPELKQAQDILTDDLRASRGLEDDESENLMNIYQVNGRVKTINRVRRLQGHMDAVLCVQFDKRRLVSGGLDRVIRIWDIRSGRSVHKLYGHKGGISCLKFEKRQLVSGSWDTSVMVWDLIEFRRIAMLTGHKGSISCLSFNQEYIVSGSHDKTIRVWDRCNFLQMFIIKEHLHHVTSLQLDGSTLITASSDKTVKMCSLETRQCLKTFEGSKEPLTYVKSQGDLIVGGNIKGQLFFWSKDANLPEVAVQAHQGPVLCVVYWRDHIFTTSSDTTIKEWDLASLTCVRSLHGHKGAVFDLQVSDMRMVSCGADGLVRVWDLFVPTIKLTDGTTEEIHIINRRDIHVAKT